jgi:hypothetical protein
VVTRGRTPSLMSGTHGSVKFHVTGKKTACRRCNDEMPKGTRCVQVAKPGKMGRGKAYCTACFRDVIDQTQRKLDELRSEL